MGELLSIQQECDLAPSRVLNDYTTRKHSARMRTDRAVTRPSSERVAKRPIVDRQTPVKTLPSPCGR